MTSRHEQDISRPGVLVGVGERHRARTADRNASFFLPHLKPGMRLLDVGCGPGTITLGLAERVHPAEVIGLDIDERQLQSAREFAARAENANVRFERGDVYGMPFDDEAFDAVFAHTVFMHLKEPLKALEEIRRVLKPGGFIGASERMGAKVLSHDDSVLDLHYELYLAWAAHRGVALSRGMHLRKLLVEAGFAPVQASASFGEVYGDADSTRRYADMQIKVLDESSLAEFAIGHGLATSEELVQIRAALDSWGDAPGSFHAQANGEAIGWKPAEKAPATAS